MRPSQNLERKKGEAAPLVVLEASRVDPRNAEAVGIANGDIEVGTLPIRAELDRAGTTLQIGIRVDCSGSVIAVRVDITGSQADPWFEHWVLMSACAAANAGVAMNTRNRTVREIPNCGRMAFTNFEEQSYKTPA